MTRNGEGLSENQASILNTGLDIGNGAGFESPDEYRAAWRAHRDKLLANARPFSRPEAYWWVEIDIVPPGCMASPYRSEEDALLRLRLPLTPEERAILAAAARGCEAQ